MKHPKHNPYEWTLTPQAQLLLASCRRFLGTASQSDDEKLSNATVDATFVELCKKHRLDLLITPILSQAAHAELLPNPKRQATGHLRLSQLVVETHRALREAEVPHLYLKGPVLAETIFGNRLLRYSVDLDILIQPETIDRADRCLRRLGFAPQTHRDDLQGRARFSRWIRRDVCYRRPGLPHGLELHWKTHETDAFRAVPDYSFESQIHYEDFHGENIPVLEDRLNAIYLCFHAAKHNWSRLRWLMDIALFLRVKNLKIEDLVERARALHLEASVIESAFLLHDLFHVSECLPNKTELESYTRHFQRRYWLEHHESRSKANSIEMLLAQGYLFSKSGLRWENWSKQSYRLLVSRTRDTWHGLSARFGFLEK